MYSMWKIMCFFNFNPHKHIALYQIHKIFLFLATSYDPFKQQNYKQVLQHLRALPSVSSAD